jgi:hypothetical protein
VEVKIPDELKEKLKVKKLPFEKDKPKPFNLIEVVTSLKLVDDEDKHVSKYPQEIELRVKYTKDIKGKADGRGKKLKLAYWDGDNWICFTKKKHGFKLIEITKDEGFGIAKIKEWPDPPIAWGT